LLLPPVRRLLSALASVFVVVGATASIGVFTDEEEDDDVRTGAALI